MSAKLKQLLKSQRFRELARYVFIGGTTTVFNFFLFCLLTDVCGVETNLANTIAVVASVIYAYVTNKLFVFRSHCENVRALLREAAEFFAARAATMALEIGGVFLAHDIMGVSDKLAKAVLTVLVIVLNYVLSKLLVFKKD